MPNIEQMDINLDKWSINVEATEILLDNSKRLKVGDGLKLPKLLTLTIESKSRSIYEFFTKFLTENQLIEHKFETETYAGLDDSLSMAIEEFFRKQKTIKNVKAGERKKYVKSGKFRS